MAQRYLHFFLIFIGGLHTEGLFNFIHLKKNLFSSDKRAINFTCPRHKFHALRSANNFLKNYKNIVKFASKIYKIIVDKLIYLCYNYYIIRETKNEKK